MPGSASLEPRNNWAVVGVLLLAIAVRVTYLLDYRSSPLFETPAGPDVQEYHDWAEAILNGQLLWPEVPIHGPLEAYWLAGWYGLAELCGVNGPALARTAQLALGIAGMLLMMRVIWRRAGPGAGLACGLLWAVHVPLVYYEGELLAEGLVVFLNCAVIGLSAERVSRWRAAGIGALLGLAVLAHAGSLLFALLVIAWMLLGRAGEQQRPLPIAVSKPLATQRRVAALTTVTLAALIVAPVAIYNSRLAGELVLVQKHGGLNFFIGNNAAADGTPNVRFGPAWDRLVARPHVEAGLLRTAGRDRFFVERALEFIREHPVEWLRLLGWKLLLAVNAHEIPASAPAEAIKPDIWLLRTGDGRFGLLLALAAVGLAAGGKRLPATAWLLIAATAVTQAVVVASGRYRTPMLPAVLALAGVGLAELLRTPIRTPHGSRGPTCPPLPWRVLTGALSAVGGLRTLVWRVLLPAGTAAVIAFVPQQPRSYSFAAEGAMARGQAWRLKGNWEAALREFRDAVAHQPGYAAGHVWLAYAAGRLGNADEQLEHLRRAVELSPEYAWAELNLGHALRQRGRAEDALAHCRRALAIDPEYADARVELGVTLRMLDRPGEALREFERVLARIERADARAGFLDAHRRLEGLLLEAQAAAREGRECAAVEKVTKVLAAWPTSREALLLGARLRAAAADERVHDAAEALRLARRAGAAAGAEAADVLDVLAMAQARGGNFGAAAALARKAIEQAERRGDIELAAEIGERVRLYESGRAYSIRSSDR